jgi:hypothetical protein
MEKLPNAWEIHKIKRPKGFLIRTDHDEATGESASTLVVAYECSAKEVATEQGPIVLIDADHVQVMIPGELWDLAEVPPPDRV